MIIIARIEGIPGPGVSDQASYCYNGLPSYAGPDYIGGLAEAPVGVSAQWEPHNSKVSVGQWPLQLRADVGRVPWYQTRPRAVSELVLDLTDVAVLVYHARTNADAGIAEGTIVWIGRETMVVTPQADPADFFFEAVRAVAGSRAYAHRKGADLYLSPPSLIGKRVQVLEVPSNAVSVIQEVAVLNGYIATDIAAHLHSVTLRVRDRLAWLCQQSPDDKLGQVIRVGEADTAVSILDRADGSQPQPVHEAGGYWFLPDAGVVYEASWNGSAWLVNTDNPIEDDGRADVLRLPGPVSQPRVRQVLLSDTDRNYPIGPSDHPMDLIRYLLYTRDGTGGTYDLGATRALFPRFSLGLDPGEVADETFEDAKIQLGNGVRAQRLWLGAEEEALDVVITSIAGPLGWAVGCGRDGRWRALRLGDTYPGTADVLVLDETDLVQPATWEHVTWTRPSDKLSLKVNPGPDGDGRRNVDVAEEELLALYPEQLGGTEEWTRAPYKEEQWDTENRPAFQAAADHVARAAQRIALIRIMVGPTNCSSLELGKSIALRDSALRNPVTGAKMDTAGYLYGMAVSVTFNMGAGGGSRTASALVMLTDQPDGLTRYAPAARVNVGSSGTTLTVDEHEYTPLTEATDAERFKLDDVVLVVDARLFEIRGERTIIGLSANTIQFDSAITVLEDDRVIPATWSASAPAQQIRHAYAASGDVSAAPLLGGSAANVRVWGA